MKGRLKLAPAIICAAAILFASTVFAWDSQNEPYDSRGNPNYRYEGSSGKKYQYDLSNPTDRLRYRVDPAAQLRDKIDPDPRKRIDKGLGQYGAGGRQ